MHTCRELMALANQPRKCRSDRIMARSLAEKTESSFAPSHSFCWCTTFWRNTALHCTLTRGFATFRSFGGQRAAVNNGDTELKILRLESASVFKASEARAGVFLCGDLSLRTLSPLANRRPLRGSQLVFKSSAKDSQTAFDAKSKAKMLRQLARRAKKAREPHLFEGKRRSSGIHQTDFLNQRRSHSRCLLR
jgi:hypothetical protein